MTIFWIFPNLFLNNVASVGYDLYRYCFCSCFVCSHFMFNLLVSFCFRSISCTEHIIDFLKQIIAFLLTFHYQGCCIRESLVHFQASYNKWIMLTRNKKIDRWVGKPQYLKWNFKPFIFVVISNVFGITLIIYISLLSLLFHFLFLLCFLRSLRPFVCFHLLQ